MLSWPRRTPLEYECVHGITWPTASSAAYCDCDGPDDAA